MKHPTIAGIWIGFSTTATITLLVLALAPRRFERLESDPTIQPAPSNQNAPESILERSGTPVEPVSAVLADYEARKAELRSEYLSLVTNHPAYTEETPAQRQAYVALAARRAALEDELLHRLGSDGIRAYRQAQVRQDESRVRSELEQAGYNPEEAERAVKAGRVLLKD